MSIFKNIKKNKDKNRILKFEKERKGVSKSSKRNLEMKHLKPDKLEVYSGEHATAKGIDDQTFLIVLPTKEDIKLFKKHFRTSTSMKGVNYAVDVEMLVDMLHNLEDGTFKYSKKTRLFKIPTKRRKL